MNTRTLLKDGEEDLTGTQLPAKFPERTENAVITAELEEEGQHHDKPELYKPLA